MGENRKSEREIFSEALEIRDPIQRAAFVARECAGAPDLRRRVETLLDAFASANAGEFMETRRIDVAPPPPSETTSRPAEGPGSLIGDYKLLQEIGEGGFGVVYMAEQVGMWTFANVGIGTSSTVELNSGTKLRVDGKVRIEDEARFDNGIKLGSGTNRDRFIIERGTHTINGNVNTAMKFRVPYASTHFNWEFANSAGSAYNVKMRLMRGGDLVISGQLSTGSDRNSKTNIVSSTAASDLEKLVNLPIYEWSYIDQEEVRHVGPMAQDFHAQFQQLGEETRLPLGDLSGVTVSALQGLHAVVQAQKTEINQLKSDLADLKAAVEALQAAAQ